MGYSKKEIYEILKDIPLKSTTGDVCEGALVLEGGAFRGVYQEGVIDCLLAHGINFQTTVGVSAGALNGFNYQARQQGRGVHINIRYRHDHRFVGIMAFMRSRYKSVIGFDYVFNKLPEIPDLDMEAFHEEGRRFVAVATNLKTGKACYFDGSREDILNCVRASATLPYISTPVIIDGEPYLDGGCADRVPFKWAMNEGYNNILVVRTRDKDYRTDSSYDKKIKSVKRFYPKYKKFVENLAKSDDDYNVLCDELQKLEEENRVFVIYPSKPLKVKMLEGDLNKLKDLYLLGYNDMESRIDDLKKYLSRNLNK